MNSKGRFCDGAERRVIDTGTAELQELSSCSLSQHTKGKVSYSDLYPVIVLTRRPLICMSSLLLRGNILKKQLQTGYVRSAKQMLVFLIAE